METGQSERVTAPIKAPVATPGAASVDAAEVGRRPDAVIRLRTALERVVARYRSRLIVVIGTAIVAAGQLAEDLTDSPPLQMAPPTLFLPRWTLIAAVLYMLASVEVIQFVVQRSLEPMQRVIKVDASTFRAYADRMRPPKLAMELAFIGISAALVVLIFVVVGVDLPMDDPMTRTPRFLPSDPIGALAVLAGYTVVGWAGLRLVVGTVQLARVLRRLSHEPLDINVYDTSGLVPLGNVALGISMAPAGVIIILLLGLGQPTTPLGWTVLLLATTATILALLLPLRGIHREMSRAKSAALERLSAQLRAIDETVSAETELEPTQVGVLADRASTLIALRKAVQEMTTWPFRDTVTFGRAVLIASAPLIYTVLSELIRVFWIAPLSR